MEWCYNIVKNNTVIKSGITVLSFDDAKIKYGDNIVKVDDFREKIEYVIFDENQILETGETMRTFSKVLTSAKKKYKRDDINICKLDDWEDDLAYLKYIYDEALKNNAIKPKRHIKGTYDDPDGVRHLNTKIFNGVLSGF